MSAFYISAAHKSSGKTTLSIGLAAAIKKQGLSIQTFKKGPDYIDPIWLSQASGQSCRNLDFFTSSHDFILSQFQRFGHHQDMVLVEGNMGLFDGISLDGSDSNAAMAKLLDIPVVLVVDCSGTSRGIAPLILGYQQFDQNINYAGVILNKVAGNRHERKLREMVETYTDMNILGTVPRNPDIQLTERHLGLIPSNEIADQAEQTIALLAQQAAEHIDIKALKALESPPQLQEKTLTHIDTQGLSDPILRIGIARDKAFGFYYPGDLERFKVLGVDLVTFNALEDPALPGNLDGLFIGGGFPETQLQELSENKSLLEDIRKHITSGLPTYAECGGLMYLCKGIITADHFYPLCNVIPGSVRMHQKPQGRGYVALQSTQQHPWYKKESPSRQVKAHEFHYSALEDLPDDLDYAYAIKRGTGIDGVNDGIIIHNLLASYTHLRRTDTCTWVDDFVSFVKHCKE